MGGYDNLPGTLIVYTDKYTGSKEGTIISIESNGDVKAKWSTGEIEIVTADKCETF